jgi:hypothetical protein
MEGAAPSAPHLKRAPHSSRSSFRRRRAVRFFNIAYLVHRTPPLTALLFVTPYRCAWRSIETACLLP